VLEEAPVVVAFTVWLLVDILKSYDRLNSSNFNFCLIKLN